MKNSLQTTTYPPTILPKNHPPLMSKQLPNWTSRGPLNTPHLNLCKHRNSLTRDNVSYVSNRTHQSIGSHEEPSSKTITDRWYKRFIPKYVETSIQQYASTNMNNSKLHSKHVHLESLEATEGSHNHIGRNGKNPVLRKPFHIFLVRLCCNTSRELSHNNCKLDTSTDSIMDNKSSNYKGNNWKPVADRTKSNKSSSSSRVATNSQPVEEEREYTGKAHKNTSKKAPQISNYPLTDRLKLVPSTITRTMEFTVMFSVQEGKGNIANDYHSNLPTTAVTLIVDENHQVIAALTSMTFEAISPPYKVANSVYNNYCFARVTITGQFEYLPQFIMHAWSPGGVSTFPLTPVPPLYKSVKSRDRDPSMKVLLIVTVSEVVHPLLVTTVMQESLDIVRNQDRQLADTSLVVQLHPAHGVRLYAILSTGDSPKDRAGSQCLLRDTIK